MVRKLVRNSINPPPLPPKPPKQTKNQNTFTFQKAEKNLLVTPTKAFYFVLTVEVKSRRGHSLTCQFTLPVQRWA